MWFDQKIDLVPRVLSLISSRQERERNLGTMLQKSGTGVAGDCVTDVLTTF